MRIRIGLLMRIRIGLLALDGTVYVPHKEQGCTESDSPQHEEEAVADAGHVAEEE